MLSSAATGTSTWRANFGQLRHGRARLFDVLQRTVSGQRSDGGDGLGDRPPAVGVDAHGRNQCAHRADPRDVVGQRLPGSAALTFAVRAPGNRRQHVGDAGRVDGGHGRVDGDAVAQRGRGSV